MLLLLAQTILKGMNIQGILTKSIYQEQEAMQALAELNLTNPKQL